MNSLHFDTELLPLLPPWYREILDYQEICKSEEAQLEALARTIHAVADNFFFQTMEESAVAQWEEVLRIVPNPQTEGLAFRRARLLNRVSSRPPFTLGFLYQKLDELIGPGEWQVRVDYPSYTLYVESSAQNQSYATEVAFTINQIKPAHVVFVNTPYLQAGVLLSESIKLSQRTFHYNLGSWGLGVLPFATEQEQGVIKMPTVPSIQAGLLTGTAGYLSDEVASARVNGSVVIPDIAKSVSGSTLTVTYTVLPAQAEVVTQAELLDAQGQVLTASTVYVPVTAATVMKHIIPVSEGVKQSGN